MRFSECIVTAARGLRYGLAFDQLLEMRGSIEYRSGRFMVCAAPPEHDEAAVVGFYQRVPTRTTKDASARELVRAIGELYADWSAQQQKGSETK